MFSKIHIGKTILEGVKRAFKINVSEITPDDEINDAAAKAIKYVSRLVILIVLYKLFPEQWESFFNLVMTG